MSLYAGGIALATPPDSAISIAPGELPAPPAVSGHAYCLDNNEYGEDLSTMWQQLALQQLDASQQHPEAQQCLTYETQAVSEEDVEQGIDQEIHHLLLMKQQLHNRKQLRQQQAPMLLGPPLASPAPATAGMAEQSLELEFDRWGAARFCLCGTLRALLVLCDNLWITHWCKLFTRDWARWLRFCMARVLWCRVSSTGIRQGEPVN